MLNRPKVVFLDEPTIGLYVIAKEKIRSFIQEMNVRGVTFILTTEVQADWSGIADVTVLKQVSEMEAELELDTEQLELKEFIRIVNDRYIIHDMSINALSIDRVIKELYQVKI
ncbi:hypothetical protein [Paenibacillus glacialis]|nr:hypothetical protein [Paenibacillus glacialis]